MKHRYIPYYRVSTERQGRSGLGLDAQRVDALRLIGERHGTVIKDYTDIETGKNPDRPQLRAAIEHAKLANATLVVAKVDRLARNLAFIATLMESKVNFVCCDCPAAEPLHLHVLAMLAEHEGRMISQRTKAALAAAKAKGVKLGSKKPGRWKNKANGWVAAQAKSIAGRRKKAEKFYETLLPLMLQKRDEGRTIGEIADWLNEQFYQTMARRPFSASVVWRIFRRFCPEKAALQRKLAYFP